MNSLNKDSIDLIRSFEGLKLDAYKDAVGVWTIGYGHTSAAGDPVVKSGMHISLDEAINLLKVDLSKFEHMVQTAVRVPINDNQYGALVSFCYNVGPGNFNSSTLLKKVNAKDFSGAAAEFAKWNKAKGKVLVGLTRRRAAEAALFLKPDNQAVVNSTPVIPEPAAPVPPPPSVKKSAGVSAAIIAAGTAVYLWWHDLVAWVSNLF